MQSQCLAYLRLSKEPRSKQRGIEGSRRRPCAGPSRGARRLPTARRKRRGIYPKRLMGYPRTELRAESGVMLALVGTSSFAVGQSRIFIGGFGIKIGTASIIEILMIFYRTIVEVIDPLGPETFKESANS
jgi:hypothetical protein